MSKKFVAPTEEEVRELCKQRGYPDYAEEFLVHHNMLGWIYGKYKTPITDWRAALQYWNRRAKESPQRPELQPYEPRTAPTIIDDAPTTETARRMAKKYNIPLD